MKPPLKPFTVEVKRSRSGSSVTRSVGSEPPVFIDAKPIPASPSPSQARQLAEQMFGTLTAGSSVAPETRMTAESVFRAVAPNAEPEEELITEPVPFDPPPQDPAVAEVAPAEPRKAHEEKIPPSAVPAKRPVKPKPPLIAKVVKRNVPAPLHQEPRAKPLEVPSPVAKIDEGAHIRPIPAIERKERDNWGWGPGERWKKRLRHLR
jgi:hypothetical protein